MRNEIFERLKKNNPKLARKVLQNSEVMRTVREVEAERIAIESWDVLQQTINGITLELLDD